LHKKLDPEQQAAGSGNWYYHPELLELYKKYLRVMLKDRGHLIDAIDPQNEIWGDKSAIPQLRLARATREVVKEVAPHILIVAPTVPPGSYGSPWGSMCKKAGVGNVADVVAGHFYVGRGPAALGCEKVMEEWCLSLRSLFTSGDKSKPVWNTEWCTNFPISFYDHPNHTANTYAPGSPALRIDPHLYAVINVRQFIAMVVHGIKSFWHVYYAGSSLDRRLLEYDWTPNPAGVAFSAATFLLDGARFVDHWNPCPDLRGYVVDTPRGAAAVFFGRRLADGEKAVVKFADPIPAATILDTMGNPIGEVAAGSELPVDNDPVYVTAPTMKGTDLLACLNKAIVTPPLRKGVVAAFLFDGRGEEKLTKVADETGSYVFEIYPLEGTDPKRSPLPVVVKDKVDRGPAAATFDYPRNRCLYFPRGCKGRFVMRRFDRLSHVFDATGDPGMGVTVEAWVKLGARPDTRDWVAGVIFEKNRYRHAPQYRLYIDREGRGRWMHSWGTGDQTYEHLTGPRLAVGKWTHLAGVTEYDGKTMRCRLYVDGRLVKESSTTRRPIEVGSTPVGIGGMFPPPAGILSDVFVDEIVVRRRALPAEQLGWFKGSRRADLARALASGMKPASAEDWSGFLAIDLSKPANKPLRDKSGNDLRNLPAGDWMMAGVPVRIIDPESNNGKAMVVLKGTNDRDMPERVRIPIAPQRVEKLHFLHFLAHGGRGKGQTVLTYVVTCRDGRKFTIDCRKKIEIADWWYQGSIDNARIAWTGSNRATSKVRLYLYTWQNPEPTNPVRSIEMISRSHPTPKILAITALCMP